jgi:hypothetical protein
MPVALLALAYYGVGILVLGNTPGVCLFAPLSTRDRPDELPARVRPFDPADQLKRTMTAALSGLGRAILNR